MYNNDDDDDDDVDDGVALLESWQWKRVGVVLMEMGAKLWNESGKLRQPDCDCEKTFECHLCSSFEYCVNSKLLS